MVVLVRSQCYAIIITNSRAFSLPQKSCTHREVTPRSPPPSSPLQPPICLLSMNLPILDILYKWNLLCFLSTATLGGVLVTPEKLTQCCHTKWWQCRCPQLPSPSTCCHSRFLFPGSEGEQYPAAQAGSGLPASLSFKCFSLYG